MKDILGVKMSTSNVSDQVAAQFLAEMQPVNANAAVPKVPGTATAIKAPTIPRLSRANTSYISIPTKSQPNEKTIETASKQDTTPKNRMMDAFGKAMNLKIAAMVASQRTSEQISLVKSDSGKEFVDAIK